MLLVDLQRAIDHADWGARNNPDAEIQAARLLAHWRNHNWPLIHIRHDSREPHSHYRPGQSGNDFKPETAPLAGEIVIAKRTNSAFIGTDLEQILRSANQTSLVVAGVITNNSIEATVRMGGNLGFAIWLVEDACFTFGKTDWNGTLRNAQEVHAMSLANLDGEYCTVITSADMLRT